MTAGDFSPRPHEEAVPLDKPTRFSDLNLYPDSWHIARTGPSVWHWTTLHFLKCCFYMVVWHFDMVLFMQYMPSPAGREAATSLPTTPSKVAFIFRLVFTIMTHSARVESMWFHWTLNSKVPSFLQYPTLGRNRKTVIKVGDWLLKQNWILCNFLFSSRDYLVLQLKQLRKERKLRRGTTILRRTTTTMMTEAWWAAEASRCQSQWNLGSP